MVTWPISPLTAISRVFSTKLYHLSLSKDALKQYCVEYFKQLGVQGVLLKAAFTPAAVRRVEYKRTCLLCSFHNGELCPEVPWGSQRRLLSPLASYLVPASPISLTSSLETTFCFLDYVMIELHWEQRVVSTFSVPPGTVGSAPWVARSGRVR